METKQTLRSNMIHKLSELNHTDRNKYEINILERLFNSFVWKNSTTIGITYSQELEWDTKLIMQRGREQGKMIALPKCEPQIPALNFYITQNDQQLMHGYAGIMEPNPAYCYAINKNDIDLLIVPGIVYDLDGYRIGFGGGYYDRFLADFKGRSLSLAAEFQFIKSVPKEKYDIPVQTIITEKDYYQIIKNIV